MILNQTIQNHWIRTNKLINNWNKLFNKSINRSCKLSIQKSNQLLMLLNWSNKLNLYKNNWKMLIKLFLNLINKFKGINKLSNNQHKLIDQIMTWLFKFQHFNNKSEKLKLKVKTKSIKLNHKIHNYLQAFNFKKVKIRQIKNKLHL